MSKDASNKKILDVVERGFTAIEQRFQTMDERFDKIEENMATKGDLKDVEANALHVCAASACAAR